MWVDYIVDYNGSTISLWTTSKLSLIMASENWELRPTFVLRNYSCPQIVKQYWWWRASLCVLTNGITFDTCRTLWRIWKRRDCAWIKPPAWERQSCPSATQTPSRPSNTGTPSLKRGLRRSVYFYSFRYIWWEHIRPHEYLHYESNPVESVFHCLWKWLMDKLKTF